MCRCPIFISLMATCLQTKIMADDLICVGDESEFLALNNKQNNSQSSTSTSSSDDEKTVPLKKKRGATRRGLARRLAKENEDTQTESEDNIYTMALFNPNTLESEYKKLTQDSDSEMENIPSIFAKKSKGKATVEVGKTENVEPFVIESDDEQNPEELVQNISVRRSPTPPPSQTELTNKKKLRKMKGIQKTMKGLTQASLRYKASEEDGADVSFVDVLCSPDAASKPITVKVKSRSGIQRFPMKFSDTFHQVFKEMARHESVKHEQIVMFIGDQMVKPYDSPFSLNITVADIIECHIRKQEECASGPALYSEDVLYPEDDPEVISLTVQGKHSKSRAVIKMRMHEPMEQLMQKFSTNVNVPLSKMTFQFDGEEVRSSDLASDLELEDGYTIDVSGV